MQDDKNQDVSRSVFVKENQKFAEVYDSKLRLPSMMPSMYEAGAKREKMGTIAEDDKDYSKSASMQENLFLRDFMN